jgi:hypothetical protein
VTSEPGAPDSNDAVSPTSSSGAVDLLEWDINFRGNLRLWPEPSPALSAIAKLDGRRYDEESFLKALPEGTEGKSPSNTRRVREPVEALRMAGLATREGDPAIFRLTRLGRHVFSYLGALGEPSFANQFNRNLIAEPLVRGLSVIVEHRVIWRLMRSLDDKLTNRELNAALGILRTTEDIPRAVEVIARAREAGDEGRLGDLVYDDAAAERKAINPKFLLAGGGGTFISVERDSPFRELLPAAIPLIDSCLRYPAFSRHLSGEVSVALLISDHSMV